MPQKVMQYFWELIVSNTGVRVNDEITKFSFTKSMKGTTGTNVQFRHLTETTKLQ